MKWVDDIIECNIELGCRSWFCFSSCIMLGCFVLIERWNFESEKRRYYVL